MERCFRISYESGFRRERAAQRIVADLGKAGYIESQREGRRNFYSVRTDRPFHLPFQRDIDINALLGILVTVVDPASTAPAK